MRIESIEIFRVALPLLTPWRTAYGEDHVIEPILVRLSDGSDFGWGEASPLPTPNYSPESARTAYIVARDFLAPLLLGQNISSGEELQERLSAFKGNFFAKAVFDAAWWDLHAKRQKKPLWKVLGGENPVVESGADFGVMDNISLLLKEIERSQEQGYARVKLKYRPGWGLEMLREVRAAFPDTVFHVDCNGAYTLDDLPMLRRLDEFNLAMIEQPLKYDDLIDHATLQAQISTPICLDESITSTDKARKALQIGACRVVNIKPGRVGGLTNAMKINEICRAGGVPCWIGGMLESTLGTQHCVALATLPNITYPNDIFSSTCYYASDLTAQPMVHCAPGKFAAREGFGIGTEPLADQLHECTIESTSMHA